MRMLMAANEDDFESLPPALRRKVNKVCLSIVYHGPLNAFLAIEPFDLGLFLVRRRTAKSARTYQEIDQ